MDKAIANAICSFVSGDHLPVITEFLDRDAPKYEWTTALVEALVGQALVASHDLAAGVIQFASHEGTVVLQIEIDAKGAQKVQGLMAGDLADLLQAVRIHEFEAPQLMLLPPDIRMAELSRLLKNVKISPDRLRRLSSIWVTEQ